MKCLIEYVAVFHTNATSYRLRPNPDSDQGYAAGAVLEWSDDGKKWKGYFYIPHEAMPCIGQALINFAESAETVHD